MTDKKSVDKIKQMNVVKRAMVYNSHKFIGRNGNNSIRELDKE